MRGGGGGGKEGGRGREWNRGREGRREGRREGNKRHIVSALYIVFSYAGRLKQHRSYQ